MLYWLPVHQCIMYKLCVLMHGVPFGYAPAYLQHLVAPLSTLPGRAHLSSVDIGQYDIPCVSSSPGSRAFSVTGPQAWNRLPASLWNTVSAATLYGSLSLVTNWFSVYTHFILYCSVPLSITVSHGTKIFTLIDWMCFSVSLKKLKKVAKHLVGFPF